MQFRDLGRLRVIRRIEGRGKEMRIVGETFGGGVWKFGGCDDDDDDEDDDDILDDDWKTRTGMGVRERV
jgi:hypothetical protein